MRYWCENDTWTDWTVYEFNTKALPTLYTLPVEDATESSAEVSAYLSSDFIHFNGITDFGFEYQTTNDNVSTKADDNWQKLAYTKIDTIRDDSYSAVYRIFATLNNLNSNDAYLVREYATTENGFTTYSNVREFETKGSALHSADNALNLTVYPNPAKDVTVLSAQGLNEAAYIYVLDLQGRVLYKQMLNKGQKSVILNTSNFTSGVYYVRLQTQKASSVQKLVVK